MMRPAVLLVTSSRKRATPLPRVTLLRLARVTLLRRTLLRQVLLRRRQALLRQELLRQESGQLAVRRKATCQRPDRPQITTRDRQIHTGELTTHRDLVSRHLGDHLPATRLGVRLHLGIHTATRRCLLILTLGLLSTMERMARPRTERLLVLSRKEHTHILRNPRTLHSKQHQALRKRRSVKEAARDRGVGAPTPTRCLIRVRIPHHQKGKRAGAGAGAVEMQESLSAGMARRIAPSRFGTHEYAGRGILIGALIWARAVLSQSILGDK